MKNQLAIFKPQALAAAAFLFFMGLFNQSIALANELAIENKTDSAIINIFIQPQERNKSPFFMRLDLFPGRHDKVENPDIKAAMRVDTGLEFWFFPVMDFGKSSSLIFCPDHPVCAQIISNDGKTTHINGEIQQLVPQKGSKPVCNLDRFRPAMPMKEVCALLPGDFSTDDNGALITGLGFGGLTWAARLIPAKAANPGDNPLLEHLELRLPLTVQNVERLLSILKKQEYVPWQAEFPGKDIEFDELPAKTTSEKQTALENMIYNFLKKHEQKHKHGNGENCEQASILMAPGNNLAALENADEPKTDTQLFTIYLRPCANTLLLDVAAYRANS